MNKKLTWIISCIFMIFGIFNLLYVKRKSIEGRNVVEYEKLEKLTFQDLKNGEWQTLQKKSNIVYFHRAIYDRRKFHEWSSPCITMFVLSNTLKISDLKDITCGYTFFNKTIKRNIMIKLTDHAFRWRETHLQEFVIQCPVNGIYPIPTYVFLERSDTEKTTLKIERPYSGKYDIGLCVPVVYGSFNTDKLIEWFEFHKYFGVDFFDITLWNVSYSVLKVFKHYEAEQDAMLNVIDIPFQVKVDSLHSELKPSKKPYFLKAFMPIALNECYLMNSLRANYILSIDFDEFIYLNLTKYRNFNEFLKHFGSRKNFVNLLMGKIYFDITCQLKANDSTSRQSFILQHSYRQSLKSMIFEDNPKSFSKPSNCPYIGNHFCVWYKEKSQTGFPRAYHKDVFISHFRKKEKCDEKIKKTYEKDNSLVRVEHALVPKFKIAKKQIFG